MSTSTQNHLLITPEIEIQQLPPYFQHGLTITDSAISADMLLIAILTATIASVNQSGVGEVVEERGEILHIRLAELRFNLITHHALYVRHRVAFEQPPYTLLVLAALSQR